MLETPLERARSSLEGLSVGDAFGDRFFGNPSLVEHLIELRALPAAPWPYTDDTNMALSIVWMLRQYGAIEQDALARSFAERYAWDRKYGPAMHRLLQRIAAGEAWQVVAPSLFEGQGSYGNGAAMRAAPIGAYFAENLGAVAEHARRSAEVTHAHPEGIAGAVAVALAAAHAWRVGRGGQALTPATFIDLVREHVPDSVVAERLRHARNLAPGSSVALAVAALGNGTGVSAQDTVPFALWCAAQHLEGYEDALWLTVSGLGDRDTTCAIVGGIVALSAGVGRIPSEWRSAREALPTWPFDDETP